MVRGEKLGEGKLTGQLGSLVENSTEGDSRRLDGREI